jgi:hypothetical protein
MEKNSKEKTYKEYREVPMRQRSPGYDRNRFTGSGNPPVCHPSQTQYKKTAPYGCPYSAERVFFNVYQQVTSCMKLFRVLLQRL